MADIKGLQHLLDLQDPMKQFNMTAPENLNTDNEEAIDPESDPMAFAPAEEAEPRSPGALASASDIAAIHALPLPEAQRSIAAQPKPEVQAPEDKSSRIQNILAQLQQQRSEGQQNLGLLTAGNQIAQAMASGYGAKIGDGSEAVKSLQAQNEQPIKDYKERIENEENDANSDISKFMRAQAYETLKKLNPEKKYNLENMTAAQLKKAMGTKLLGTQTAPMEWIATDRVTMDGTPIKFNRRTGQYMAGDRMIQAGEVTPRDIARRDALTDQYGLAGPGGALMVKPTDYSAVDKNLKNKQQSSSADGEPVVQNVKFSDFMKTAPKVAEQVTKLKEQFIKDMSNSRETAAASTTLASKLKPGSNGEIDSGLLGGIQTQAAKMAGQKGVLTDQDLVKFAGAGGVKAKLLRLVDNLMGNMSDDDIKFFKRFSELMNSSLNKIIDNDSQYYVDQVKQVAEGFAPGFTDENAKEWLAVGKVAPSVQGSASAVADGKIKVKLPNGKIGSIPKENLQKFLKDFPGSQEIK